MKSLVFRMFWTPSEGVRKSCPKMHENPYPFAHFHQSQVHIREAVVDKKVAKNQRNSTNPPKSDTFCLSFQKRVEYWIFPQEFALFLTVLNNIFDKATSVISLDLAEVLETAGIVSNFLNSIKLRTLLIPSSLRSGDSGRESEKICVLVIPALTPPRCRPSCTSSCPGGC